MFEFKDHRATAMGAFKTVSFVIAVGYFYSIGN
jgi:hypothetical protein